MAKPAPILFRVTMGEVSYGPAALDAAGAAIVFRPGVMIVSERCDLFCGKGERGRGKLLFR